MTELIFMTGAVLAGWVACLAQPSAPEQWSCVKAARPVAAPGPQCALAYEPERDSEPGFADGLSSGAMA